MTKFYNCLKANYTYFTRVFESENIYYDTCNLCMRQEHITKRLYNGKRSAMNKFKEVDMEKCVSTAKYPKFY